MSTEYFYSLHFLETQIYLENFDTVSNIKYALFYQIIAISNNLIIPYFLMISGMQQM